MAPSAVIVPISARISPGDQPRRPVGDDEHSGSASPSMRWADVYVPHVSPASMSPASMAMAMGRRLRLRPGPAVSGLGRGKLRWLSLSWWWASLMRSGIRSQRVRASLKLLRKGDDDVMVPVSSVTHHITASALTAASRR